MDSRFPAPLQSGAAEPASSSARPAPVMNEVPMVLRYDTPAAEDQWESSSLPIGNGAMGASIFGGVESDLLTLNEKTLWSGGPGVPGYNFGNYPDSDVQRRHERLQEIRDHIASNGQMDPSDVMSESNLGHPKVGYGSYQSFGKLRMTTPYSAEYTNYERMLDLDIAQATVTYDVAGTSFRRDLIASYPDNVIAMRLTASQPGKITFTSRYDRNARGTDLLVNADVTADGGRITLRGEGSDNGLRYNGQVLVVPTGGTMTSARDSVTVTEADEALVLWAGGTDYAPTYPAYRTGVDPSERIASYVDGAATKGWDALVERHRADYKPQFEAFKIDLDGAPIDGSTAAVRDAYTGRGAQDRSLETLFAQYGRYLTIASSRDGSLPANLQGVWADGNNPAWAGDYHVNINLQMNYWPTLSANLPGSYDSYLDYVKSLIPAGEISAKNVLGIERGWMVMNETTPYGFTGVYDWPTAAWFPEANAWMGQAFYWKYLYSGDTTYLRDEVYPILKQTSEFWIDYLQSDPRDGTLVANPSYSPEHGWFTAGAAMSQQIATELFTSTKEAADLLGIDDSFTRELSATLAKTDDGLRVADGKIKEWKADGVHGAEAGHRHISQLYALFPGRAISPGRTPELAEAARGTLNDRGDGGTGWSKAWMVNFWAHLGDGDRAHTMLAGLLRESTMDNLWDTHPPFQIDGNFGGTSGVLEMLVQNEADSTVVLAALPSAWANGSFDGARAWGDATVGATWRDGRPVQVRFQTGIDGERSLSGPIAQGTVRVLDPTGAEVDHTVADGKVTFRAEAGRQYRIEAG